MLFAISAELAKEKRKRTHVIKKCSSRTINEIYVDIIATSPRNHQNIQALIIMLPELHIRSGMNKMVRHHRRVMCADEVALREGTAGDDDQGRMSVTAHGLVERQME